MELESGAIAGEAPFDGFGRGVPARFVQRHLSREPLTFVQVELSPRAQGDLMRSTSKTHASRLSTPLLFVLLCLSGGCKPRADHGRQPSHDTVGARSSSWLADSASAVRTAISLFATPQAFLTFGVNRVQHTDSGFVIEVVPTGAVDPRTPLQNIGGGGGGLVLVDSTGKARILRLFR